MLTQSKTLLPIPGLKGPSAATLTAGNLAVGKAPTGPWTAADGYTYDPVTKAGTVTVLVGPGSTFGAFTTGTAQLYVQVTVGLEVVVIAAEPGPVFTDS